MHNNYQHLMYTIGGMAGVLESIKSGQVNLKKARVEERKPAERKT